MFLLMVPHCSFIRIHLILTILRRRTWFRSRTGLRDVLAGAPLEKRPGRQMDAGSLTTKAQTYMSPGLMAAPLASCRSWKALPSGPVGQIGRACGMERV